MITKLNVTSIYVLDKEEALRFYVDKLGLEKGNDVRQGGYRWLTIRVPGEPGTEISLEQPGPPMGLSWAISTIPLFGLIALIVIAWRRTRPAGT